MAGGQRWTLLSPSSYVRDTEMSLVHVWEDEVMFMFTGVTSEEETFRDIRLAANLTVS